MAAGRAEIMVAMNSEALLLGYCSLKKEQTDIILTWVMMCSLCYQLALGKVYVTPASLEYLINFMEMLTH